MDNKSVSKIATPVGINRESVYVNIDKALDFGPIAVFNVLADLCVNVEISHEDKAW